MRQRRQADGNHEFRITPKPPPLYTLWVATPEMTLRMIQGWPSTRWAACGYLLPSLDTPRLTPLPLATWTIILWQITSDWQAFKKYSKDLTQTLKMTMHSIKKMPLFLANFSTFLGDPQKIEIKKKGLDLNFWA
jgi:hypothetical protein